MTRDTWPHIRVWVTETPAGLDLSFTPAHPHYLANPFDPSPRMVTRASPPLLDWWTGGGSHNWSAEQQEGIPELVGGGTTHSLRSATHARTPPLAGLPPAPS